jgi:hypothetical protein
MSDIDRLLTALERTGVDRRVLEDPATAHLVVAGPRLLSARQVPGLEVEAESLPDGLAVRVRLAAGTRLTQPVHLCFGIIEPAGLQRIVMNVRLERESAAHFLAHCLFPEARQVKHLMEAAVEIGEGAQLHYSETHYHGPHGGIEVVPKAKVTVGREGRFLADFTLTVGRVGRLDIDYDVEVLERGVAELTARASGRGSDAIRIREKVVLAGAGARGLIKTRLALQDEATAEVIGITEGNAAGARGHVDCLELVRDRAVARAIPQVSVTHPLAKVTHEAAIGSVDQRQLETLMARGLTPEEAVDVIVRGILK